MVNSCCSFNCKNRFGQLKENGKKLQFHKFPLKNPELLKKWIIAIRRDSWKPTKFSCLCGEHFLKYDYKTSDQHHLKDEAVPSIFNFSNQVQKVKQKRKKVTKSSLSKPEKKLKVTETSSLDKNMENVMVNNDGNVPNHLQKVEQNHKKVTKPSLSKPEKRLKVTETSSLDKNMENVMVNNDGSVPNHLQKIEQQRRKGTKHSLLKPEKRLKVAEASSLDKNTENVMVHKDGNVPNHMKKVFYALSQHRKVTKHSLSKPEKTLKFAETSSLDKTMVNNDVQEMSADALDVISAQEELIDSAQKQISPVSCVTSNNDKSPVRDKISQSSSSTIANLRRKVKILQQKLNRRDKEIGNLKSMLLVAQKKSGMSKDVKDMLKDNFGETQFEILSHQVKNKTCKPNGRRYSSSMKEFALTLYFYSPRAYEYLRRSLCLPHPAMLRAWVSSRRKKNSGEKNLTEKNKDDMELFFLDELLERFTRKTTPVKKKFVKKNLAEKNEDDDKLFILNELLESSAEEKNSVQKDLAEKNKDDMELFFLDEQT